MDQVKTLIDGRTNTYGEFNENARLTQQMYDVMQLHPGWARLDYGKRHAAYMIVHKLSRIVEGDPEYDDNWADIEGYARLAKERLKKPEPPAKSERTVFDGSIGVAERQTQKAKRDEEAHYVGLRGTTLENVGR
jgi:hypothetical protein